MTDELSKWAGAGIALLAAGGGYVGSVTSQAQNDGVMAQKVETLQVQLREHDVRERDFVQRISDKIADIDARVKVLESRK